MKSAIKKKIGDYYKNATVLVTGGTGTIGCEISIQLLEMGVKVVRVMSNDENALYEMSQRFKDDLRIRCLEGDVRDKDRLKLAMEDVDFVFHAAALKHVPLSEDNPFEAIQTNVLGTMNALKAALENNVKKFINISTDKAVNPVSTMGATKLLTEKLTLAANAYKGAKRRTIFTNVRFGNVVASRGSVVPLFIEQIKNGGPVTLTHERMTRYFMSIENAVNLLLQAGKMAQGQETFILKMPIVSLKSLVKVLIKKLAPRHGQKPKDIKIKITQPREGEKMHEELISDPEFVNLYEIKDMFILAGHGHEKHVIKKFKARKVKKKAQIRSKKISDKEIEKMLKENDLF